MLGRNNKNAGAIAAAALALALLPLAARAADQRLTQFLYLPSAMANAELQDLVDMRQLFEAAKRRDYQYQVHTRKGGDNQFFALDQKMLRKMGCEGRDISLTIDITSINKRGFFFGRSIYYVTFQNCIALSPLVKVPLNRDGTVAGYDVFDLAPGMTGFANLLRPDDVTASAPRRLSAYFTNTDSYFTLYRGLDRAVDWSGSHNLLNGKAAAMLAGGGSAVVGGLDASGSMVSGPLNASTSFAFRTYRASRRALTAFAGSEGRPTEAALEGRIDHGCSVNARGDLRYFQYCIRPFRPTRYRLTFPGGAAWTGYAFGPDQVSLPGLPTAGALWPEFALPKACQPPFKLPTLFKVGLCGGNGKPWVLMALDGPSPLPGAANQLFVTNDAKSGELRQLKRLANGDFELTSWVSPEWVYSHYFDATGTTTVEWLTIRDGNVINRRSYVGPTLALRPNGTGQCSENGGEAQPCEYLEGEKVESFN